MGIGFILRSSFNETLTWCQRRNASGGTTGRIEGYAAGPLRPWQWKAAPGSRNSRGTSRFTGQASACLPAARHPSLPPLSVYSSGRRRSCANVDMETINRSRNDLPKCWAKNIEMIVALFFFIKRVAVILVKSYYSVVFYMTLKSLLEFDIRK